MAEGGLGGRLLGEAEGAEAEAEAEGAATALDPTAAAFAAREAANDPPLAARIGDYFERQSRYVEVQLEHLHEQRMLNLGHLRVRRWRERMQLAFQALLALVTAVIVAAAGLMIFDAATSRSVVVGAFKSPPALAMRGLSGEVVAAGVLDSLQKLQTATRGPSRGLSSRGVWVGDVKIEVPETGVSIGEVNRLLHERLGHDVHIDGDLVQRPDGGVALTIRGDDIPAKTFNGPLEDIEKLTTQAAEYAYGRSQPWQYAVYLVNTRTRNEEAVAFTTGALARARADDERANLANALANAYDNMGEVSRSLHYHQLSKDYAKPRSQAWWKAWGNTLNNLNEQDTTEQAALQEAKAFLKAAEIAPSDQKPEKRFYKSVAHILLDEPLNLNSALGETSQNGGRGANTALGATILAEAYIAVHDDAEAERAFVSNDADNDPLAIAFRADQAGQRALERGDAAVAVSAYEHYWDALTKQNVKPGQDSSLCELGYAYALAGRTAEAESAFQKAGVWSECYGRRGQVLAGRGDLAAARRAWDEGVAHAPDAAPVYLRRGEWERDHGDFAAAGADLSTAAAKAPHWAEPFKAWGDLLARQGRWKDAAAKYDEALKYAPAWPALKAARTQAAAHL